MQNDLKVRLIKGFSANAFGQLVTIGIQLLSVPLFIYYWGAAKYGEWLLLTAIPSYLSLSDIGFASVAANEMTILNSRGDREGVVGIYQSGNLMIAFCGIFLFFLICLLVFAFDLSHLLALKYINSGEVRIILMALSLHALLCLFNGMAMGGFRAIGDYALGTFLNNATRLGEWGCAAVALSFTSSVSTVALVMLIVRVICTVLLLSLLHKKASWLIFGWRAANLSCLRRLLKPSLAFMAFPLGYALNIQGITLVIGSLFGGSAVAMFSTYRTLTRFIVQAVNIASHAFTPEISAAYGKGDFFSVSSLYKKCKRINWVIGIASAIFLLSFGRYIISMWTHNGINFDSLIFSVFVLLALTTCAWQGDWSLILGCNKQITFAKFFITTNVLSVLVAPLLATHPWHVAVVLMSGEVVLLVLAGVVSRKVIGAYAKN